MSDETPAFTGLAEVEERESAIILAGGEGGSRRCACGSVRLGDEIVHGEDACRAFRPRVEAVREIFPAPLVSSRLYSEEGAAPSAVQGLAQRARAAGWEARVQMSTGCTPHATTGRPSAAPKRLWAVRMLGGGNGAYAVYEQGSSSWKSIMLWGLALPHFPYASVTDLGEWLAAGGRMEPGWYDAIRARVAAALARKKAAARGRVKKGAEEAL